MNFKEALEEWRARGGVLQCCGPDYDVWTVRGVADGEEWEQICRFALQEAGWSDAEIDKELADC